MGFYGFFRFWGIFWVFFWIFWIFFGPDQMIYKCLKNVVHIKLNVTQERNMLLSNLKFDKRTLKVKVIKLIIQLNIYPSKM